MNNKEAIEILTKEKYPHPLSDYEHELTEALDLAIKALEQTEIKGDLISREALKVAISRYKEEIHTLEKVLSIIDNAPTVEYTFEEAFKKTVCKTGLYCEKRQEAENE